MKSLLITTALFVTSLANAQLKVMDYDFLAPITLDRTTIPAPQVGLIVFDTLTDAFYGLDPNGNWQPLSTGATGYLSSNSSNKTPSASGDYLQMSGNSVILTSGSWVLNGIVEASNNGTSPGYSRLEVWWSSTNGNDSPSPIPTAITVQAGGTIGLASGSSSDSIYLNAPTARITVSTPTVVYLVPRPTMTTPGNSVVRAKIYAERLR